MSVAWTQEQLEGIESAIYAIATGAASYTINGRTVTKANLQELRNLRMEMMRELGMTPRVVAGRLDAGY